MKFRCRRCNHEFEIIEKIRKGGCSEPPYVLIVNRIKKTIQCPKCKTVKIRLL